MSISKKILSACCFVSLSFTGFAKANLETEVKNLKALVEAQAKRIAALESKQFGTVDLKKVLENSKLGKKAKAELQEFGMTLQKKSQAEQTELMKLQKSIQEDKLLAKDAKEKKMAEFQQKVQAFQMKQQQMQFEMQQKQAELMKGFFDKTTAVAKELGQAKKLSKIENSAAESTTLFTSGTPVNLTKDMIAALDKQAESKVTAKG